MKNNQIHGYLYCSYEQPSKPTNDVTFDFSVWSTRILVVACERIPPKNCNWVESLIPSHYVNYFQAGVNWSLLHGISACFTFTLHQQ